jgi:N-succinyldiaminopimelate aminotransferase
VLDVALPDAGFYLWAGVAGGDDEPSRRPAGSIQCDGAARQPAGARPAASTPAPAASAWRWSPTDECLEAAQRIVSFIQSR